VRADDLYPRPRRLSWEQEMDALAATMPPQAPVPPPRPVREPEPAPAAPQAKPGLYGYGKSRKRLRPRVAPVKPRRRRDLRPPVGPIPGTPEVLGNLGDLIAALAAAFETPADEDSESDSRPYQCMRRAA
jgi:hypothetical protein